VIGEQQRVALLEVAAHGVMGEVDDLAAPPHRGGGQMVLSAPGGRNLPARQLVPCLRSHDPQELAISEAFGRRSARTSRSAVSGISAL
jgi:hypothetical protein